MGGNFVGEQTENENENSRENPKLRDKRPWSLTGIYDVTVSSNIGEGLRAIFLDPGRGFTVGRCIYDALALVFEFCIALYGVVSIVIDVH